ncbi:hypothetical protein CsatA_000404 [Cannabis sativa]
MAADVASYHSGDGSGNDPTDPTSDPNTCESSEESIAPKKKGSGIELTSEEGKGKNTESLPNVDHIQKLKKLLGERSGYIGGRGHIWKRKSSSRYTHARTLQSADEIQRLEGLIIKLQKQVQHVSEKVPTKEHLPKDNKIVDMHSTRPSQPHMPQPLASHSNMHGPLTSQYQWQIPQPPPLQQPLFPYNYPYTYGAPLQQPMPPYHYPNTNGLPLQQPMLPYHYPNTNGLPLQQPTPPYHNPNIYGLPLQQPSPPYHNPNTYGLPLQQPPPPYHYPNTHGPPLQQPIPPYHYPNTHGLPLQQLMPHYHYPNTHGLPLQQPMPHYHYPNTNGLPLQQPTPPYHNPNTQQPMPPDHYPSMDGPLSQPPPMPKVSIDPDPKPRPSPVPDNAKDACPKREHTTQDVLDHPEPQASKKARDMFLGFNIREKLMEFSEMNILKRKAFFEISLYMVENDDGVKKFFNRMDVSSRGMINMDELIAAFKISLPCPSVDLLMKIGDLDEDGYLNYLEFVSILVKVRMIGNENRHIRAAFEVFDENQSGYIEMDDLRHCFAYDSDDEENIEEVVEENIEEVVEAIMEDVDIDKDGKISYDEFAAMMKSGTPKAQRQ